MLTRRRFIQYSAAAGAGLVLPLRWSVPTASAATPLDPLALTKYVDPLPRPAVAVGTSPGTYEIAFTQLTQQLHRQLPPTTVWGYGGSYPGPTIEARTNEPITVKWINALPTTHLLPIDYTLDGAAGGPDVRAVPHLHGGHVSPAVDGGPDAWFVPGAFAEYSYPNMQQASTLWYHDHALGITRLNVLAGLAGFYLLRDDVEDSLNLPSGPYEVPLVIQDRMFNSDGSLLYPSLGVTDVHPVWVPEFFGDTILVNGKVWPYLDVEPRKYRFRILNGSNARFYTLRLSSEQKLFQIGTDGGLLRAPVPVDQLLIAPGERADVVVDFTAHVEQTVLLRNRAKAPFPAGSSPDPRTVGEIMQFRVTLPLSGSDTSALPATLRAVPTLDPASAAAVRDVTLVEQLDPNGNPITALLENRGWTDPVTIFPRLGTTEVWRLINTTGDAHPIHLHLVQFQVLDRQSFNTRAFAGTGTLKLLGQPRLRDANEAGWKDTVRANPGEVTRIIARFEDFTGRYPVHCHILEHEDNDMMRPFEVIA